MANEITGSARLRVELDEGNVVAEARLLGRRIKRALEQETSQAGKQLSRDLQAGLKRVDPVRLGPDLPRFTKDLRSGLGRLDPIQVRAEPEVSRFRTLLSRGLRDLAPVRVRLDADVTSFRRELERGLSDVAAVGVAVEPRTPARFHAELARGLRRLPPVPVRVTPDLRGLQRAIERARLPALKLPLTPDGLGGGGRSRGGLPSFISGLGSALSTAASGVAKFTLAAGAVSLVSAALASATTAALGFTAALAPATGLLAGLPASAALAGAALLTLKAAVGGLGEAFGLALKADEEKFQEALEDLPPAARAAALELRRLKPAFDELRASVSAAFFRPLRGELRLLVADLKGPLKAGMSASAAEMGRLTRAVTGFARSAAGVRLINDSFGLLSRTLGSIRSGSVERLLAAVGTFTRSTVPAFDTLGAAIDHATVRLSLWLERSAASGDGLRWIDDAKTALADLGGLLADIGSISAGVFRAANASGAGLAGTLGSLLDGTRAWVNSLEGQTALVQVFDGIRDVGSEAGPVIRALVVEVGALSGTIGDLAHITGPALVRVIGVLGDSLGRLDTGVVDIFEGLDAAIDRIADAGTLPRLAGDLSDVLSSVAPLGPALGDLVVELGPLASTALDLVQAFAPLGPVAVGSLTSLASGLGLVGQVLSPVVSLIGVAAEAFALLPGPIQTAVLALGVMVALRGRISAFGATMAALPGQMSAKAVQVAAGGMRGALSGLLGVLGGPWGIAITAGVTAISLFGQKQAEARARVEGLTGTLDEQTGALTANSRQWLAAELAESGAIDQARQLGIAVSDLIPYLEGNAEAQARVNAKLEEYGGTAPIIAYLWDSNLRASDDLRVSLESLGGVLGDAKQRHEDTAAAAGRMAERERETAGAVSATTSALQAQSDELRAQIDPVYAFMRAQEDVRVAQKNYNKAVKDGGINSREAALAAAELTTKGLALGSAAGQIGDQLSGGLTPALRGTLSAAGLTDKQIQGVEKALKDAKKAAEDYEGDYRAKVGVDGVAAAMNQLRAVRQAAIDVSNARGGVPLGGGRPLADGAVIDRPTFALVGEAGREVVIPLTRPQRARQLARESGLLDVLAQGGGGRHAAPAKESSVAMGGGTHHTWHIYGAADPDATAQRVIRRLELTAFTATAGGF